MIYLCIQYFITFFKGDEGQYIRNMWARGMDYLPWEPPIARHLSDLLKVTFCGDYPGFLKMLEDKSEEQVKEMLTKRECLLNVNAIFHCIIGE